MNILTNLNAKQKEAVTIFRGPVLVIAGPGSGKTRCLTHRIAYLIQQNIPARNILAVTFTNKAAGEMKERVNQLIGLKYSSLPIIGTFHAICLQILRQEIDKLGYQKNFIIYDETDRFSLIKKIIKELKINPDQFKPGIIQETISRAKDELIDYQTYQTQAQEFFPKNIAKIYQSYQQALVKANALDFDDLIMLTAKLFQKNQDVLEKYQEKWQYILVDEAHDTNVSQYLLINLLAQKHKNLWVIADPDQSIYSWRGADYRNILNFEKDYPEAKVILLEENYRSSQNILQASHYLINKNSQRKEKNLWTKNSEGPLVNIVKTDDEEREGDFIINEIENLTKEGFNLKDFTVLYRTNAQSRAIEEAFLKANLPYKMIGTVRFYERREIKDILAYLKLVANPNDSISLERIVNIPPRGIGKITFQKQSGPQIEGFNKLIDLFRKKNQKMKLHQLIDFVIKKTDYEKYIKNSQEGEKRWENVEELFTVAGKYDKLENFLEETSLLNNSDEVETRKDLVNLMTLHCAKGLEFPIVFIAGCEEGIFPHSKSMLDASQMEEERRLAYVGLTRAKQKIYLTFTDRRRLWGQTMINLPSRFLFDIPENLIEFQEY